MEMARQQTSFQDFNDAAQKVAENVDEDSPSVKQIQDQMEEFNERWNALTSQVTQRLSLVSTLISSVLIRLTILFRKPSSLKTVSPNKSSSLIIHPL